MGGVHGSDERMETSDAQNPIHIPYEHHYHPHPHGMSNGNGHGINKDGELEHEDSHGHGEGSDGMLERDVVPGHGNFSDNHGPMVVADHGTENGDQLTLSFQGQVYVCDSVPLEKVQAVLLLMGGHEIPASTPGIPISTHHNNKGLSGTSQRFSVPQRLASLIRFREKRKERNFDKKIRYTVRKEVALRRITSKQKVRPNEYFNGPRAKSSGKSKGALRDLSKAALPQAGNSSSTNTTAENGNFEAK